MNSGFRLFFVFLLTVSVVACAGTTKKQGMTIRQHIAESYGIRYFSEIEKLQYVFNVKKGENLVSRFWIWEPHLNKVTFKGMDHQKAFTYNRSEIDATTSEKLKKIDAWFINDSYWLLFPFHVAWDTDTKVEDIGRRELPMSDGRARCVIVSYPAAGGYSRGDEYDLYLDDNYRLIQWAYRRGGSKKPTRVSTWEDHRKVGPITLSLNHRGEESNFRVWFTNVGVKMAGVDSWMFSQ